MTCPPRRLPRTLALAACGTSLLWVLGCGEEEAPPPPPPVVREEAPPPPPPEPTVTSIEDLKKQLGISDMVVLEEEDAPDTDEERIAVLKFFDAFAKGDDKSLGGMLSAADKQQLAALVKEGSWKSVTADLNMIEVKTGSSPESAPCAFGLFAFEAGDDEAGVWLYDVAGSTASFDAELTPPDVMRQLSGADPIGKWYELIAAFLAVAEEPDVVVEIVQEDRTVEGDSSEAPDNGGGGGMGGGGAPMRRKPVDTPINPGGPPGLTPGG